MANDTSDSSNFELTESELNVHFLCAVITIVGLLVVILSSRNSTHGRQPTSTSQ